MTAYVLKKYKGQLNYTKLIKILYLADRKAMAESGSSISGDDYASMKDGPVLSGLYALIKNRYPDRPGQYYWNSKFQTDGYDIHDAGSFIPEGKLSEFETELLDAVDAQFHSITSSQIIDYVHDSQNCPEWKDTQSCIPLPKSDILKNLGFSDEEIECILEEDQMYKAEDDLLESLNDPVPDREICYG